jgi:adenosylcobalamin-dependent ribonucleoside-triphosphate reductase
MFDIAKISFHLPESFLETYKGKQPEWGELGYITFKRTYARDVGHGKTEEYWQTCRRVVEGTFSIQKNHCKSHKLPWKEQKALASAKKMFQLMWEFKFLPPGRGLWAMGTDYVARHGGAALNNCAFVTTDDIEDNPSKPFAFLMDMSMVGVGVGFDTRGSGKLKIQRPDGTEPFQIPDSREGWVESLVKLIDAYAFGKPLPIFSYDLVRPAGSPIRGFGGLASGPGPLKEMHEWIAQILDSRIGQTLSSADLVDIGNLIGRCVVAGNVRRSAEIVFGDPNDQEFIKLKQDPEKLTHHRWASNNSIFAKVGMDYRQHALSTAINGEPGYEWLDNAQAYGRMVDPPDYADKDAVGGNPCLEQTLHNMELCTLVETFPARHNSQEEYLETLKIAYLYAKTVTLVPTAWEETNAVMMRNRRIGLSQSGIIRAFNKHGRRQMLSWCDVGYQFIKSLDVIYSNWLGIPRSIKKTSIKPSGTVSLLPGEPPGIHYPHSQFYIRRIRLSVNSPLVPLLTNAGYHVEPEVGKEDTSLVVSFPIKEKFFERCKDDVSIWEQVANAVAYQKYWADNQVSITVTFKKHEQQDIPHILEMFEDSLKGISFLPLEEHGYIQAPYETISEERYLEMTKDVKPIKFVHNEEAQAPKFCDGEACSI